MSVDKSTTFAVELPDPPGSKLVFKVDFDTWKDDKTVGTIQTMMMITGEKKIAGGNTREMKMNQKQVQCSSGIRLTKIKYTVDCRVDGDRVH